MSGPSAPQPAGAGAPRDTAPAGLLHLRAAALAAALLVAALAALSWWSAALVHARMFELAGSRYVQKNVGLVVQQVAISRPDVLPLYGSSEIDDGSLYHARDFFYGAPSGFMVLTVAGRGTPILETLLSLGALGDGLRGRKVVVSLSPHMFHMLEGPILQERLAGNFSPIQTLRVMLSSDLSQPLRQQLARRLTPRPELLQRNTVLGQTVRLVASDRAVSRPLLYALRPLAHLQLQLLETQDRVLVLGHLLFRPSQRPSGQPVAAPFDWPALIEAAEEAQARHAMNNPFGVDDDWWTEQQAWFESERGTWTDEKFLHDLDASDTWTDLEQLLQVLQELGAEPLLMGMPYYAPFMAHRGISPDAYQQYYRRVDALAERYGARTALLQAHESDRYFFRDLWSHIGPKGWVYFDQVLDAYYHDALR